MDQLALDDCVDYAVEREVVVEMLEDLERARDQRSVPVAEVALTSADPVVTAAGLRLLGPFAASSESATDLAAPLLTSPYVMTNQLAAEVLSRSSKYAVLAQQYRTGHVGGEQEVHPWAKTAALDYTQVGFSGPYPNATPYAPGDSAVSVGLATTDGTESVLGYFRKALGRDPVALGEVEAALATQASQKFDELGKQTEALVQEFQRTQDPKLMERVRQLSAEASASRESSLTIAPFPQGESRGTAQVFVAEQYQQVPTRVVVVYREPLVDRTIVMFAWSGQKYPPVSRAPKPMTARSRPY